MTLQFQENAALSADEHLIVYHHLTGQEVRYPIAHLTTREVAKIKDMQEQHAAEKLVDTASDKIVMFFEDSEGRPTFFQSTMKEAQETQEHRKTHPTYLAIHYQ